MYGGHAPIQGAHVYLLQPGTTGYGSAATSILGTGTTTSPGGFTLTANTSDPNVPAGAMYEITDGGGNYNFTGAYACTVGQPVYIYAFGGNIGTTTGTSTTTFTVSQIVVSNAGTGSGGTATYTFTINSSSALTAGQTVTVAGLNGGDGLGSDDFSIIDGAQTVLASPAPGTTTFSITATNRFTFFLGLGHGNIGNGTYPTTGNGGNNIGRGGTVTATTSTTNPATQNNSVVQLATLGNCPASGNFTTGAGSLSFVFMNEVSTVAAAYTFQPFTLATNNDAWHIGTSGSTQALLGIANAANTAAQLYNIQGNGPASTTFDGEGHIANATTPNGNGTVPQATIDTLANILAACVDSTTASSQCTSIFNVATDNGETTGTKPTDTATAAINIARYPDGNGVGTVDANYASDLFGIPTGTVPFTPALTAAPNDWTLSIAYTGGGIGHTQGKSPHDVAVDASGNIYTTSFAGNTLAIFSPLGVPASSTGFGTALNGPGSVAIDSTSSFVWLVDWGNVNVSRFTTAGGSETEFPAGRTEHQDAEIDGSGNVWVTADDASALIKLNSAGTVQNTITGAANINTPYGIAIQPGAAGNVWVADEGENDASAFINSTGANYNGSPFRGNHNRGAVDVQGPVGTAIDSTGNVWFANNNGSVSELTRTGGTVTGSPFATGSANYNDGIAIDGSNNIWVTNTNSATVFVLNDAGATITPNAGYLANPATEPDGIAIDPSGNVWYDSLNAAVLYEVVGAASPTVTPLSAAVANSKLGTKP